MHKTDHLMQPEELNIARKDNMYTRRKVVEMAQSFVGLKESDGSYKKIIDIYNTQKTFPRNTPMKYGWNWCACTWSAIAVALGYQKIMPIEVSCGRLIALASEMGIWQEDDSYIPLPGDAILYDWQDTGKGNDKGWPEHVGIVEEVNTTSGYITVIEGNHDNAVSRRIIIINGRYIRGYIAPDYDVEVAAKPIPKGTVSEIAIQVIAGKWSSGNERISMLKAAGYNPTEIQAKVNSILNTTKEPISSPVQKVYTINKKERVEAASKASSFSSKYARKYVTTDNLYCRTDAGTNKKALCKIPKGTTVTCYGYYSRYRNVDWLYILSVVNGIEYIGFSSKQYLR